MAKPNKNEITPTLSDFERMRLQNIAANNAILKDLEAKATLVANSPRIATSYTEPNYIRASSRPKVPQSKTVKKIPPRPVRQSARLAGIDANDETLKRKREVDEAESRERAKTMKRRISDDLELQDIMVAGTKHKADLEGLGRLGLTEQAHLCTSNSTTHDHRSTATEEVKSKMQSLTIYEKWSCQDLKIVPQRVAIIRFHPSREKPLIFAGDKEGHLGIFDASQDVPSDADEDGESMSLPTMSIFKNHSRTVTSLLFCQADAKAVYSGSHDSSIRKLDLAASKSVQAFAPKHSEDEMPITAMDSSVYTPHVIYFSTLHGIVGRVDLRDPRKSTDMWQLSPQKIGGFSLHPIQGHLLATASLDRTLKIWDLRKMIRADDEHHPAMVGEHGSRLSVSHAAWSAGGYVATSSYDDTVKIYDFSTSSSWEPGHSLAEAAMQPAHVIKHNNQTGRWVTILKPFWQADPEDGLDKFVIGNMNRSVDVFAADGEQLAQLGGDEITAVPAAACFHPSMDWVCGGTASGKLCLWM